MAPAPFGSAKQLISVKPAIPFGSGTTAGKDMPAFSFSTATASPVFAQARKSSDLKAADAKPTSPKPVSPKQATPSASVFKPSSLKPPKSPATSAGSASVLKKSPVIAEKHVSFAATLVKQSEPVKRSSAEELAEARKLAEDNQKKIDDEHRAKRAEKEKKAVDEKERAVKEQRVEEREERRRIREHKHREEEERRAEKKRRAELRKDLQRMSNDMISNQFVSTINKFDGELEQFRTSLQRSRRTIRRVCNTALPPIEIDESVTKLASATVRLESLKISDIGTWDSFASVLAEALSQVRDDIEATRVGMRDEQVEMSRVDARGAEIERILASANSMRAAPNATVDGGMNPLEREIRRQMRTSLISVKEESEKASQFLEAQEAKHAGSAGLLGISLQGTSPEYIDRKINSIADALEKNSDVIDRLSQELDEMGVARLSAADIEMSSGYASEILDQPVLQSLQTDPATSLEPAVGQDASRGTLSRSAASMFIETRHRRTLVKDALTSKARGPVVVLAAKMSQAKPFLAMDSEDSVVPEPLPLPNMERYVKAFGMLSIDEQGGICGGSEVNNRDDTKRAEPSQ
ncbi:hypothetical protein FBU59_000386 [Linderina macrospora]|uniref:Uncharacterized protein n=1 Tax=Linderina macrospora TaxID=4868 RepID=A0ACC1JH13_9FUNG|nr:hypothetical protein FBU59_000386 [Linderina macrospora]